LLIGIVVAYKFPVKSRFISFIRKFSVHLASFNYPFMFSKELYVQRRKALCAQLQSGILLFLGNKEAPCNYLDNTYRFRQDSTFLYFFGLDEPDLAATIDLETDAETLYGDDIGIDSIVWMGPQPPMREKADHVAVAHVSPMADLAETIQKAVASGRVVHYLPPYRYAHQIDLMDLLGIHPNDQKAKSSEAFVRAVVSLRAVKQPEEVVELDKAANIGYMMHYAAMQLAKLGMLEQELVGVMEGIAVSSGTMPSFPIILSQNGETLHNHTHHQFLTDGRLLLIDAGAETNSHYASDFTRTIPCNGIFTSQQKALYTLVLEATNHAMSLCRPGVPYKQVHLAAARVITEGLKGMGMMKGNTDDAIAHGAHAMFFPCGLGHNMGMDVHDMENLGENWVGYDETVSRSTQFGLKSLRMAKALKAGNVMTVEPGIYFIPALMDKWRAEKVNTDYLCFDEMDKFRTFGGIRIEEDIIITPDGYRMLGSKRLPATVAEIEEVMRG
jgi:Xaa-Pro aminopeptidase